MTDNERRKRVEIEVPPEVADEARRRAGTEDELEPYLLDYVLFEYDWVFPERD